MVGSESGSSKGPGIPILASIKTLRAMKSIIDFDSGTMYYEVVTPGGDTKTFERVLSKSPKGHLLWDPADAATGSVVEQPAASLEGDL